MLEILAILGIVLLYALKKVIDIAFSSTIYIYIYLLYELVVPKQISVYAQSTNCEFI